LPRRVSQLSLGGSNGVGLGTGVLALESASGSGGGLRLGAGQAGGEGLITGVAGSRITLDCESSGIAVEVRQQI